jgi:outer membrane lipoprotein-sorting protein
MFKILTLAGFFFIGFYCQAQYPGYSLDNHPETFKKSLAAAISATGSIRSDFTQEKSLSLLSENIHSKGKFWFEKKDRLRMEYIQPYPYLMILNNGKIYIKEGQKENKISANSNKTFGQVNRILIDCVSGTMLDNPDFQSAVFESKGNWMIELRPMARNLKDLYKNINIVIDKKDYSATAIEMFELSGDKTIIRFQNKEINAQFPDSVFNIP